MRASDRLGAAVAVAMALSLTALAPVSSDRGLFTDCLVLIAVVGVSGILSRRLLPGEVLAGSAQAIVAATTWLVLAFGAGLTNPFALSRVLNDAVEWTVQSSAPMGPNLGVRLVASFAIGLLAFLADQLAVAHGQPAWTLLPLGVPYLVPALALPSLVGFPA
ncbi:MAG TPA: transglutaminaseTgpA domain-containing protein, partial [Micropruina sp.]|nr:transglutaminaseTgpA domain-containing protein [Micropruina sp.]HMR21049.1 transglutaminaseTgpA domain-containing protein [Micropruina sp.]